MCVSLTDLQLSLDASFALLFKLHLGFIVFGHHFYKPLSKNGMLNKGDKHCMIKKQTTCWNLCGLFRGLVVTWDFFIRISAETLSSVLDAKLCSMPVFKVDKIIQLRIWDYSDVAYCPIIIGEKLFIFINKQKKNRKLTFEFVASIVGQFLYLIGNCFQFILCLWLRNEMRDI